VGCQEGLGHQERGSPPRAAEHDDTSLYSTGFIICQHKAFVFQQFCLAKSITIALRLHLLTPMSGNPNILYRHGPASYRCDGV
jgi:hypothetical protein